MITLNERNYSVTMEEIGHTEKMTMWCDFAESVREIKKALDNPIKFPPITKIARRVSMRQGNLAYVGPARVSISCDGEVFHVEATPLNKPDDVWVFWSTKEGSVCLK